MPRRTYSGTEIVKTLGRWDLRRVDQTGSHVKLRYRRPETDEVRIVIVPLHDELETGTLRNIAEQAGPKDFQAFLDAIDALQENAFTRQHRPDPERPRARIRPSPRNGIPQSRRTRGRVW